jgi:hypothetical protein
MAIVDLLGKPVDSVKLGVQVGGCTMGSGSTNDFANWDGQQAVFCSQSFSHFHSLYVFKRGSGKGEHVTASASR